MQKKKPLSVPKKMQTIYNDITRQISEFCQEYLNQEYEKICYQLCAALCRKRPSPLERGRSRSWACAIIHAIGTVNFLFDPSQTPHMKASELYEAFAVSNSNASSKSKQIRDLMDMHQLDPDWTLPSRMDDNPLVWMVMMDDVIIDIRMAPRELQEAAYRQGVIPYIPADRNVVPPLPDGVMPINRKQKNKQSIQKKREHLRQAQDLVYEAYETESRAKMVELALKAIELSEDCADAYLILAEQAARHPKQAKELLEKAVQAGKNAIGPKKFKEYKGHFWGFMETRPYMRARENLAYFLWSINKQDEAITHAKDMLELNPNDNQGMRYVLLNWLFVAGTEQEIEALLEQYPDDIAADWHYTHALYLFRKGDQKEANKILEKAIRYNKHLPAYLLGHRELPKHSPDYISWGDESEAEAYAYAFNHLWTQTKGALEWLSNFCSTK
jgi:tetratricopeptide (TPR) repeat protein